MTKRDKILGYAAPVISVVLMLVIWAAAACAAGSEYILPNIGQTLKAVFGLFGVKAFYLALLGTLLRTFIAFFISLAAAFSLAAAAKKSAAAERFIKPFISVARSLPTVAVVLLLLVWTNSKVAPVIVTMLVVLPTEYTGAYNALSGVDENTISALKLFGVSERDLFFKVKLKQTLPEVYSLVGSGLSLNLKLMVAAEVLSQTARSMGYLLNASKVNFEISKMIAIVIVTVILGGGIEGAFSLASKKAGKWK